MRPWVLLAVAACYSPSAKTGSPCDPGVCPPGLVCSPATHTCELPTVDASLGGDDTSDTGAGTDGNAGPWLAGWGYRKKVTITPPTTTALADFPVSVVLAADTDLDAHARSDGKDLVFTAADGTTLLHSEVVAFDPTTGALDAWVRTTLPAGNEVYLYFGGPASTPLLPWSAKVAGAWHMDGAADVAADSAAGHALMAPTAAATPGLVPGMVGMARSFDGLDDTMTAPDPADGSLDFGTTSFSYSVWVNVTASKGAYDTPFYKGGSSATVAGYNFELGTGLWTSHVADGTVTQTVSFGTELNLLGQWHHLAVVVDRTNGKLLSFTDGTMMASTNITVTSLDTAQQVEFSRLATPFAGLLDEVRVYSTAMPQAWFQTEVANATNRATFLSLGPVETP